MKISCCTEVRWHSPAKVLGLFECLLCAFGPLWWLENMLFAVPHEELSSLLQRGDFESLFRRMGWDNPERSSPLVVSESALRPVPVADKRGVTAWLVDYPGGLPERSEQHRGVRQESTPEKDRTPCARPYASVAQAASLRAVVAIA